MVDFLGSSDPKKDQERYDRIESLFSQAIEGSQSAKDCLNDMANKAFGGSLCGVGSTFAVNHAKKRWADLVQLEGVGKVAPKTPAIVGQVADMPGWTWLLLAGLAGFVLVKMVRRNG